jgi:septal ring factor EnvC (AmiA/AmiB activator)
VVGPLLAVLAGWGVFRQSLAVVVLGFCLALSASGPMYANDLDDEVAKYREELGKLRGELEQNKAVAENIAVKERTLSRELEKMEKEIDALEQDVKSANQKKETNKSAINEGQTQLAQCRRELADARRELEQWLKMLSVRRMPSVAEVVFFDIPHSDITLRHHIVSLLAQKEAEASELTEALSARYDQHQNDLRKRSELDSLYVETTNLRVRQLLEKKQQREGLLGELRAQKTVYAAAINDLEASSKNLQDLLDSPRPKPGNQLAAPAPFRDMKGLLPWPAQGGVAVPFGRIQNLDSPTYTRHLGIDISAPANSEIRVVHDGLVAYCDWFRGYGKLVIVDHGEGYSTIYSHCSEILVNKGEFIRAGAPLALVGETGSLKGPFLYFEIRENGQPVDPLVWLQRRM